MKSFLLFFITSMLKKLNRPKLKKQADNFTCKNLHFK